MRRNLGFSLINVFGLMIGMVCAALIFLWIQYKYEYNRQWKHADGIYIFENNQFYGKDIKTFSATSGPLAQTAYNEIPGFDKVVRVLSEGGVFSVGDKYLNQSGIYADSSFFDIFPFPAVHRSVDFSLNNPTQIAISSKMAAAYFDKGDPIGKTMTLNKKDPFIVGMVYDIPSTNTSLTPDYVLPMRFAMADSGFVKQWSQWGNCGMRTYATLDQNASVVNINQRLKGLIRSKTGNDVPHEVFLYPLTRLGLYNTFEEGKEVSDKGNIKYVRLFFMVALVILLIACINFMNLSTARSEKRAMEIGLKKVVGATRLQLMLQFIFESLLMALIAAGFAILLLLIVTPWFAALVELPLRFRILDPLHLFSLLGVGLFCGLLAGIYPCLYLSSFRPANAIKKQLTKGRDGAGIIRKALVVAQFSISIILIIATIVINKQIIYTRNRDLGFDRDQILVLNATAPVTGSFEALRNNLMRAGVAKEVAMSTSSVFSMFSNGGGFRWKGGENLQDALITQALVSPQYFKLMGIKINDGRAFHDNIKQDSNSVIINDAMAKLMGAEGRAGKILYRGDDGTMPIVGVTGSFSVNNIYEKPEPIIFYASDAKGFLNWGSVLFIKLTGNASQAQTLGTIEGEIKKIDSGFPFEYHFLDEEYDKLFKGIRFAGNLALLFGSLAIFISCLGLLGLSAFMTEQRKKEIGVRKVLGASVYSITRLLNQDFIKMVLVACIIAVPAGGYLMSKWLEDYKDYHTGISWWVFLLAMLMAIMIALVTVSAQAIRAAIANPVKALRSE
ncbi:ABC transporter permease [Niabella beijingensis]|uniref:ABC transporter permease n=1 Tax=Niabella beijingensis TaxID=2872700 RepID=UPI001CC1210C|nr:ABC transporter permease [Niabella beijingensis]MBZ4191463.1 ABC transporter permease [Niabella beijingensis]